MFNAEARGASRSQMMFNIWVTALRTSSRVLYNRPMLGVFSAATGAVGEFARSVIPRVSSQMYEEIKMECMNECRPTLPYQTTGFVVVSSFFGF